MDYFSSFEISATGLMAERLRLQAVATNLANANTTAAPGASVYQPVRVVTRAIGADFSQHMRSADGDLPGGVQVLGMENEQVAPRMVYDPKHPDADANGFVAQANVDPLSEMVTMMAALRAYEANIKAMGAAHTMAEKALEIGGNK